MKFKIVLGLAVLLAAVLRLHGVNALELTHWDEGAYVGFAQGYGPAFRGDPWIIYAPPVYPLLVRGAFALYGVVPWIAIAVSGAMGVLGVWLIGRLTAAWFSPTAGAIAALLLALEPLHLAHSRLALTETTFCVGILASLWAATRALDSDRPRESLLTGVCAGVATLTKFHGFLPLAAFGLVSLWRRKPRGIVWAAVGFVPAVLIATWLIATTCGLERFSASREQWVNGLHPWAIRRTLEFCLELSTHHTSRWFVVIAASGIFLSLGRPRDPLGPKLGLVTLLSFGVLLCVYRNYVRLFVPVYVLLVPYAAFVIERAVSRIRNPVGSSVAAIALSCGTMLPAMDQWVEIVRFRGAGYPTMAEIVRDQLETEPGAVVVVVAQQSLFPYLGVGATSRVFSVNEDEAITRLEADSVKYLVTDQDPWRHGRMRALRESLAPRLVEAVRIPNPLPKATLLDRLGHDGPGLLSEGDRSAYDAESSLVLYRIKPVR